MDFQYVINCDTLPFLGYNVLEDPREILQAIKEAGYVGVDLPGDPDRVEVDLLREITADLDLVVPEVSGAWAWAYYGPAGDRNLAGPDEEARQRGVAFSKRLVDLAAELGAWLFPVCPTQRPIYDLPWPKTPSKILREKFMKSLQEVCEYAAGSGITVVIEPLNRYEAWAGVATTVQEVISLIQDLNVSNLGIQPDVFHMNIAEDSVCGALRLAGPYIRHMHINDTNHACLGTGHADFHSILRTLKDVDYGEYASVYMPFTTQEAWQGKEKQDLRKRLVEAIQYLKTVETAVDLQREMYNAEAPY